MVSRVNGSSTPTQSTMRLDNVDESTDNNIECAVCLDDIEVLDENHNRVTLACNHLFHSECIGQWLERHHNCPICRAEIPEKESEPSKKDEFSPERIMALPDGNTLVESESAVSRLSLMGDEEIRVRSVRWLNQRDSNLSDTVSRVNAIASIFFGWNTSEATSNALSPWRFGWN